MCWKVLILPIVICQLRTHAKHTCKTHVKDLAEDVAEAVLGAAKDGSDLVKVLAVGVLGAAKNESAEVFVVKFILSTVKDLAQDVAEDVLGAAKDGSDLVQDVAECFTPQHWLLCHMGLY